MLLLPKLHLKELPSMYSTLLSILCLIFTASPALSQDETPLSVPQQIMLEKDSDARMLIITWQCNPVSVFDIEIYRTEFMDIVFNETVELSSEKNAGECHWNWTSEVPLECTSLSVRIRSRDLLRISEWSPLQTTEGNDLPDKRKAQMYPIDKVVMVGSNSTFCCILGEGQFLSEILYKKSVMKEVRLSRRTYAVTQTLQPPSTMSGANIICRVSTDVANNSIIVTATGTVMFVGYPPGDEELICETQDFASAVCQWKEGRSTHLFGPKRGTTYTLNGRYCKIVSGVRKCSFEQWQDNWTLVAKNPLGKKELTDSAPLTHRVRPVAPKNLTVLAKNSRNATLQWSWQYQGYQAFPLICQVHLESNEFSVIRNYSGAGLSLVLLEDLWAYETYRVRVRCGAENHFWKWGAWSLESSFQTKMDRPEMPDLWIWMGSDNSGRILWKPLSKRESNGDLLRYEVTQRSASGEEQHLNVPVSQLSVPLSVQDNASDVVVTLLARNSEWASQTTQLIPKYWADLDVRGAEISSRDGGFDLSWPASSNTSRGYAVEWFNTSCGQHCSVDWLKVPETTTSARIESSGLEEGVRYTISVYALSDGAPELLERRHGYLKEMVPVEHVLSLEASRDESSVVLSWQEIPLLKQRGFVRGYSVYLASVSEYTLLANITDPSVKNYTIRRLGLGTYKFTVKAYTAAGEEGGSTVSIKMDLSTDVLILAEILIALAAMSVFLFLVTVLCYRKRKWVKKAFYPEIPEPKLPGQWGTSQATLDVKPSPHSMVHIIDNPQWDSSKEGLVPVSEEDEDIDESDSENTDTDSDEPGMLRYYNQVVGDSGQAPRLPVDSSSSSVGSADTDVTYTGIQTSPGPLDTPPQVEVLATGGYRPQGQVVQPQKQQDQSDVEAEAPSTASFGGYKPQCAWRPDSPDGNAFEGSVGSPTSVNSSQFLIPDVSLEDSRNAGSSTTWIPSFLSSKP